MNQPNSVPWTILCHPDFARRYDDLTQAVADLHRKDPEGYHTHSKAKLLARIQRLVFEDIPRDPASDQYRLGKTLGSPFKHWRRAKFERRFRLFFRYDSRTRTIIYAWVNDENTLRKAGSNQDPYAIFARMLAAGDPPDDFESLLTASIALTPPAQQP